MAKKKYKSNYSKTISIIAIVVAGLSAMIAYLPFHFQYMRKVNDLKVTILNAVPNFNNFKCVANLIFINNGNQECSIAFIKFEEQNISRYKVPFSGILSSKSVNPPPFTIKPNEVITKQFRAMPGNIKPGSHGGAREGDTIEYRLAFGIVDSKGYYHKVNASVFIGIVGGGMQVDDIKADFEFNKLPISIKLLPSDIEEYSFDAWPNTSF